jgi:hypothetical protein
VSTLLKLIGGAWFFLKGKHIDESLEEVAEKDPGYLTWAWEETSGDEKQDAFDAVTDAAKKHGVTVPRPRRPDNRKVKHRITHDRYRNRRR